MQPITQEMFTWYFKDPDWKNKFLIGSILYLAIYIVPIIGWVGMLIAYGYGILIFRDVLRGKQPTLPAWEKYGALLRDGLKANIAGLGYLVLMFLMMIGVLALSLFGMGLSYPSIVGEGRLTSAMLPAFLAWFSVGLLGAISLITFLGMLVTLPWSIAIGQYARAGQMRAGYRLGEMWKIFRANARGFVIALIAYSAAFIGLNSLAFLLNFTIILCLLSQFVMAPILFYLTLIWAHLFGIAYREGCLNAGVPLDAV